MKYSGYKAAENTQTCITILEDKPVLVSTLTWVIFLIVMENMCWSLFKVLSELPEDWQHAFERFSFSWEASRDSPAASSKGCVSCNFFQLTFLYPLLGYKFPQGRAVMFLTSVFPGHSTVPGT